MAATKTGCWDHRHGAILGSGVVLVDFWAPWCDVCQATSLVVEDLAERYSGRLRSIRVNVDEDPVLAARYHVHAVPTLALLENGQLVEQFVGFALREKVQEAIERLLPPAPGR